MPSLARSAAWIVAWTSGSYVAFSFGSAHEIGWLVAAALVMNLPFSAMIYFWMFILSLVGGGDSTSSSWVVGAGIVPIAAIQSAILLGLASLVRTSMRRSRPRPLMRADDQGEGPGPALEGDGVHQ